MFDNAYVCECPQCGRLIVTYLNWGSGAFRCPCHPDEVIHFDYVSVEEQKKNQEKYADLIEQERQKVQQFLNAEWKE